MFKISNKKFGKLAKYTKLSIYLSTLHNDSRVSKICNDCKPEMNLELQTGISHDYSSLLAQLILKNIRYSDCKLIKVTKDNVYDSYFELANHVNSTSLKSELEKVIYHNLLLAYNDLLPLIHFSFNRWIGLPLKRYELDNLYEISCFYLLKNVAVRINIHDGKFTKIATGAYNDIYKSIDDMTMLKVPINLASQKTINRIEFENYQKLRNTSISSFIPKHYSISDDGIINKEYLEGKLCHTLLKNGISTKLKDQIKKFYIEYNNSVNSLKNKLDIHPGNFIWNEKRSKLFFIDLGPIPHIGSDYYPLNNFNYYFSKIWLDRIRLMSDQPIRSVDLEVRPLP